MSTTTAVSPAVEKAVGAIARGGEQIAPHLFDLHLAEIADKASCSLLRDRFRDGFPHAAHHELLSTVAALRAVLGFSPTPTAAEVMDWQDRQRTAYTEAASGPTAQYPVVFVDGPYRGVEMALTGPADSYPKADGPLGHLAGLGWIAGPPASIPLPIVWGDTARPGHGTVRYARGEALADGLWPFTVRLDDPAPPTDARPHITVPTVREH